MATGQGFSDRFLTGEEITAIVRAGVNSLDVDGKRVLVIIPDATRSMPTPLMFDLFERFLGPRVKALDYQVALGTHQPLNDAQLSRLVGRTLYNGLVDSPLYNGKAGSSTIFNHEWHNPEAFVLLGTIPAGEIRELSGGQLEEEIPVRLNRRILEYDQIIICGPVFPHEVAGFSGGNKYFFPGIAGGEIIHLTHWLGALLTNYEVIGAGYTPVRAVIDRAAAFIQQPTACFSLVVAPSGSPGEDHNHLSGLFFGTPQQAWQAAADLSAQVHIRYVDAPYRKVISVMPAMYDDLWTAAKGMYKMEPVVADGGEVIIYAPNITEVSYTHGKILNEIGYHCRDYFVAQWDRFSRYPGGILAHSTHVKGLGQYDAPSGIETPRIHVTLATGIPEERCRRINLGYLNPAELNLAEWQGREAEGILVVPRAGEILYRLRETE